MNRSAKDGSISPRLVKTKQAAEYLAISQWKLRNLVQQGADSVHRGRRRH